MQLSNLHLCYATDFSRVANASRMADENSDKDLIEALCDWAGKSASEVAKSAGLTPSTLTRPLNQPVKHRLSIPTLAKLRARYPAFPGFRQQLDLPDLETGPGYVDIAVMPSYGGMGGGGTGEGSRLTAKLPRALIEDELRGRPTDFELIDVRGDSMMPDFHHGDQILVDKRDRDPRQPGAFALWDEDGYVVKLVERVPQRRGWYRIFSANDRYTPYEIEETETTIMGRPVWFARRL
jgi:phage repressor protein C with HTH and peptisase S24 domain